MLVGGRETHAFEEAFSERLKAPSVAVSSGTAALHLTLLALGVGVKDEVILPGYSCAAPLNAVRYVGARPTFADIDPSTSLCRADDIKSVITPKTKAIIAVHLFGSLLPMDEISNLGPMVIEDCAQAIGGMHKGCPVGAWGDVSITSFYATKVITTGKGGMVSSKDRNIVNQVKELIDYDERDDKGIHFNYSMSSVEASMGIVQLSRLDELLSRRKEIAGYYREEFERKGILMPPSSPGGENIYYRFIIKAKGLVDETIGRLMDMGITARRPVYRPLSYYTNDKTLPGVQEAYDENISIPIYPALSDGEVERVARAVIKVIEVIETMGGR